MVGVNDDANKVLPSSFQNEGDFAYLLGDTKSEFGASLYMKRFYDKVAGVHPEVDFDKELNLWNTVIEANKQGLLEAAKDINVGGLAIALAKMAVVGNSGIEATIELEDSKDIFSESLSRAVVEVNPENSDSFERLCRNRGISCIKLGVIGGGKIAINDVYKELDEAKNIYFNRFKEVIEQDL